MGGLIGRSRLEGAGSGGYTPPGSRLPYSASCLQSRREDAPMVFPYQDSPGSLIPWTKQVFFPLTCFVRYFDLSHVENKSHINLVPVT